MRGVGRFMIYDVHKNVFVTGIWTLCWVESRCLGNSCVKRSVVVTNVETLMKIQWISEDLGVVLKVWQKIWFSWWPILNGWLIAWFIAWFRIPIFRMVQNLVLLLLFKFRFYTCYTYCVSLTWVTSNRRWQLFLEETLLKVDQPYRFNTCRTIYISGETRRRPTLSFQCPYHYPSTMLYLVSKSTHWRVKMKVTLVFRSCLSGTSFVCMV